MENNIKQLVEEIKHRLKFITLEENENAFNADEVGFLVSLLTIYEPQEETDKEESLKRFKEYIKLYEREEEIRINLNKKRDC